MRTVTANDLEFIGQINRDGSGISPVSQDYIEGMIRRNEEIRITPLSLIMKTFIAFNFNVFVVKLKNQQ